MVCLGFLATMATTHLSHKVTSIDSFEATLTSLHCMGEYLLHTLAQVQLILIDRWCKVAVK